MAQISYKCNQIQYSTAIVSFSREGNFNHVVTTVTTGRNIAVLCFFLNITLSTALPSPSAEDVSERGAACRAVRVGFDVFLRYMPAFTTPEAIFLVPKNESLLIRLMNSIKIKQRVKF